MSIRVIPTFLLKGVDPVKITQLYQSGYFSQKHTKSKIEIAQNTTILSPVYGTNNNSPIFSIKDKNNTSVIIATSGHQDFEVYTKNGGKLCEGGRCDFCKEDYKCLSVGYPLNYQEQTISTFEPGNPKAKYRIFYTFWVEGRFCSFECALAYVKRILSHPADSRDTLLRDSERLLKMLYSLTYPDATFLRPAQDPQLLITNGGSLTKEEWNNSKHIYIKTGRVLMIPAKVEYIRNNFGPNVIINDD